MNIEIMRQEISEKLKTANNRDEGYTLLEPYKNILESYINLNPKNVDAYCLLGIVFFDMSDEEAAVAILKKCYEENYDTFSDDEYSMWATCSAYFAFYETDACEYDGSEDEYEMLKFLEEAVVRKSNFHQTYYGLGWYYFGNKLFEKASEAFHTAYSISKNRTHLYCEAISLLASSKKSEGIKILKSLYRESFIDEELDFQIAFILARELAFENKITEASIISKNLLKKEYDKHTKEYHFDQVSSPDEISDMFYLLGDFNYVAHFYENYYHFADCSHWLVKYFYSLKMLNENEKAYSKLEYVIQKLEEEISETELEDDWETPEEKEEHIADTKETIEDIKKCYNDVFQNNMKPSIEHYYDIIYKCYYIACPRHDTDYNETK